MTKKNAARKRSAKADAEYCSEVLGEGFSSEDAQRYARWASRYEDGYEDGFELETLDGDPSRVEGLRLLPSIRKKVDAGFNADYVPLFAEERAARRGLLQQWQMTRDPFVAAEMGAQERRELPYCEALNFLFGFGDWRIAMCLEARSQIRVQREVAWWLSRAVKLGDGGELRAFAERMEALKGHKAQRSKGYAVMFVWRYQLKKGELPHEHQVLGFLKKARLPRPAANHRRRFFSGPILGSLLRASVGRPRTISKKE